MEDKQMYKELELRTGQQAVQALIDELSNVLNKEPGFAMAGTIDAMRALDTLLTRHTNADRECIVIACACFITALTNSATTGSAKLVQCNPDEQIVDYSE